MAERDKKIRELERQVTESKRKLQSASQAESLVEQMLEAGFLIQQDDGTYTSRQ